MNRLFVIAGFWILLFFYEFPVIGFFTHKLHAGQPGVGDLESELNGDADSNRTKRRNESVSSRPNIVYVMADDMGLGDVKCYGREKSRAETPNIDRLAREGIRFVDAHAPVAHCIPTRMAIMTGRYAFRFARPKPDGPWGYLNPRLKPEQRTLGNMLQEQGYHTGYIGKWHLGVTMQTTNKANQGPNNVDYRLPLKQGPNDHGFDESFILPGSLDMYPYAFVRNHQWVGEVDQKKGWSAFNRIGPAARDFEDYKVLDRFSIEAEKYLAERAKEKQKPFFLYFALTSPHTPTSPSPKFRGKSKLGLYGDFLMETDDCLGRICKSLDEHSLSKNTLVLFTSDHGAAAYAGNVAKATPRQFEQMEKLGHFSSGIYRGYKFSAYEGGTRIPLIARWPGKISAGTESRALVGLNDMMATFADLTEYALKENEAPDSISFLPAMTKSVSSRQKTPRTSLICRSTHSFTYRKGDWKVLFCPGAGCSGNYGNHPRRTDAWNAAIQDAGKPETRQDVLQAPFCQLFHLASDPVEQKNMAGSNRDRIHSLWKDLTEDIERGRSTDGPRLGNDRQVDIFADVPNFVWGKKNRSP